MGKCLGDGDNQRALNEALTSDYEAYRIIKNYLILQNMLKPARAKFGWIVDLDSWISIHLHI